VQNDLETNPQTQEERKLFAQSAMQAPEFAFTSMQNVEVVHSY
jgi:hypothetical protein